VLSGVENRAILLSSLTVTVQGFPGYYADIPVSNSILKLDMRLTEYWVLSYFEDLPFHITESGSLYYVPLTSYRFLQTVPSAWGGRPCDLDYLPLGRSDIFFLQ